MTPLAAITPELGAELVAALTAQGRLDLARQVESAEIRQWYFEKLSAPVAETIPFDMESGTNVDVDHDGNLFGIEFLSRPDILAKLRAADAL